MLSHSRIPAYCRHRQRNLAFVRLDGRTLYLGRYDSPESHAEYDRLVGLWTLNGRRLPPDVRPPRQRALPEESHASAPSPGLIPEPSAASYTVAHLCGEYLTHMERCWARHPSEITRKDSNRFATTMRPLLQLFGKVPVDDFGTKKLKVVREYFISQQHVRAQVNVRSRIIRNMFKWGVEEEKVSENTWLRLTAVESLKRNKSSARESIPVQPVSRELIDRTLPHLNRIVAAMVEVHYHTGARPEELCLMRRCDIDMQKPTWVYTPMTHKNAYRDQVRKIAIGPKAQAFLVPFLDADPEAFLFSPRVAEQERRNALSAARTTPLSCGNVPGTNRRSEPRKQPGERYTPGSYRDAIYDACQKAFPLPPHLAKAWITPTGRKRKLRLETDVEWKSRLTESQLLEATAWKKKHRWFPYQLRHAAATRVRELAGIEAAQMVLGHRHVKMTERYAAGNFSLAEQAMGTFG